MKGGYLVLSRRVDETLAIGDDIEIVVVEIKLGRVRLGVRAPKNIRVDRSEIRARRAKGVRG